MKLIGRQGSFGKSTKRREVLSEIEIEFMAFSPTPFEGRALRKVLVRPISHNSKSKEYGQRVAVLRQGPQQAGYHRLHWDGRDAAGAPLASRIYLCRLVTDEAVLTRKLTLLQ